MYIKQDTEVIKLAAQLRRYSYNNYLISYKMFVLHAYNIAFLSVKCENFIVDIFSNKLTKSPICTQTTPKRLMTY